MGKSAIIFGASGLVGNELAHLCAKVPGYETVVRVLRRAGDPITDVRDVISEDITAVPDEELRVDTLFCCLGTTMKRAGSKEAFELVDKAMPLTLAKRFAMLNPQGHFVVITAMGADPDSSVYYNRVKGLLERDLGLAKLGRLSIVRPSLLVGERSESRPMEALGIRLAPAMNALLWGPLKKYRAIEARDVAKAMIVCDLQREGNAVYLSDELQALTESL